MHTDTHTQSSGTKNRALGWAGWSWVKGWKWDNCNSIINKYIKKKRKNRAHLIHLGRTPVWGLWCRPLESCRPRSSEPAHLHNKVFLGRQLVNVAQETRVQVGPILFLLILLSVLFRYSTWWPWGREGQPHQLVHDGHVPLQGPRGDILGCPGLQGLQGSAGALGLGYSLPGNSSWGREGRGGSVRGCSFHCPGMRWWGQCRGTLTWCSWARPSEAVWLREGRGQRGHPKESIVRTCRPAFSPRPTHSQSSQVFSRLYVGSFHREVGQKLWKLTRCL